MALSNRVAKLEHASRSSLKKEDPRLDPLVDALMDWFDNDPQAEILSQKEDNYCRLKGYPLATEKEHNEEYYLFYEQLDDPVYWEVHNNFWNAFNKYSRARGPV